MEVSLAKPAECHFRSIRRHGLLVEAFGLGVVQSPVELQALWAHRADQLRSLGTHRDKPAAGFRVKTALGALDQRLENPNGLVILGILDLLGSSAEIPDHLIVNAYKRRRAIG